MHPCKPDLFVFNLSRLFTCSIQYQFMSYNNHEFMRKFQNKEANFRRYCKLNDAVCNSRTCFPRNPNSRNTILKRVILSKALSRLVLSKVLFLEMVIFSKGSCCFMSDHRHFSHALFTHFFTHTL